MRKLGALTVLVLLTAGCGSSSESVETTVVDTITVSSNAKQKVFETTLTVGDNTGPDVVIEVAKDTQVSLTFVNPTSHDEIHLHGYDLSTDIIEKGNEAVLSFVADQAGDFEIESHETGQLLATLKVVSQ